jgi:hypothetical protein
LTWSERLQGHQIRVRSILPYVVAPPVDVETAFGQLHGKENDDEAEYDARIESHRGKIIVSHPPTEVEAPHEPLEDATRNDPRRKVYAVGRWDAVGRDQRNRDIDVAPKRARAATGEVVEGDGQDCTDQEEPDEWVIAKEVRQSVDVIVILK